MIRHWPNLALIALAVSFGYSNVTGAYFCGYDDFAEIHRANFEDTEHPIRMLTTTHFGTPKYRPVGRAMSWALWHLGGGSALPFRIKNLFFHFMAAAMVYGISWLLFGSKPAALGAGLMFGLHPLTNQGTVVAGWTITLSYAIFLTAFFLFLYSVSAKAWELPLAGSLALSWIGLFVYEANIVVFAYMYSYLLLRSLQGQGFCRRYLCVFIGGTLAVIATLFAVRHIFVSQPPGVSPPAVMIRNFVMYLAALVIPVDAVFANAVFGTPLPAELKLTGRMIACTAAGILIVAAAIALALRRPAVRSRLRSLDWPPLLFLALAIPFALGPFLAFTPHPSETYLYLPAALYAILLSALIWQVSRSQRIYTIIVALLLVCLTAATWVKNGRVAKCGEIARNILTQLPVSRWRQGPWHVLLADDPNQRSLQRYGIYEYQGVSTIEVKETGIRAMEQALQIASGNPQVRADIVDARTLPTECRQPETCFWVSAEGLVTVISKRTRAATAEPPAKP